MVIFMNDIDDEVFESFLHKWDRVNKSMNENDQKSLIFALPIQNKEVLF